MEVVHSACYFIITSHLWMSRATHVYTGLTGHCITEEFSLQSHLLATKRFPDPHTADNIAE